MLKHYVIESPNFTAFRRSFTISAGDVKRGRLIVAGPSEAADSTPVSQLFIPPSIPTASGTASERTA